MLYDFSYSLHVHVTQQVSSFPCIEWPLVTSKEGQNAHKLSAKREVVKQVHYLSYGRRTNTRHCGIQVSFQVHEIIRSLLSHDRPSESYPLDTMA